MTDSDRLIAAASSIAPQMDRLLLALLLLSTFTVVAIALAITAFCIRYRRRARIERDHVMSRNLWLEATWITAPLLLFFGLFFWGAWLYAQLHTPPADSVQIAVVAKQWMWKVQHPEGQREINELHVPVGQDIALAMTSEDVIHSFFVPAFRIKQDLVPGRYVHLWFKPTRVGEYSLLCAEYCGSDHSRMRGTVVVMTPANYEHWLTDHPGPASLAAQGGTLFRHLGCGGCHGVSATVNAPKLQGVFGRPVLLNNGQTVIADAAYVRNKILNPAAQIPAGYPPIMPSFQGQVTEEQILALIAYLQSLATDTEQEP